MNYADIKKVDVANGPGVRVTIFVSGCNHHCKNCFNKETWDFNYGKEFTSDTIKEIIKALAPSHIKGLTLLGGEPFEPVNQKGLLPLVKEVRKIYPDKDIWAFSGFLFDKDIVEKMYKNDYTKELLSNIDVLVDGPFIEELKNPSLKFKGSSNQRTIDIKETLKYIEKKDNNYFIKESNIKLLF